MSTPPRSDASPPDSRDAARERFRRTLVRVLSVQAVTLVLFWLLQARYGG